MSQLPPNGSESYVELARTAAELTLRATGFGLVAESSRVSRQLLSRVSNNPVYQSFLTYGPLGATVTYFSPNQNDTKPELPSLHYDCTREEVTELIDPLTVPNPQSLGQSQSQAIVEENQEEETESNNSKSWLPSMPTAIQSVVTVTNLALQTRSFLAKSK